MKWLKRLAPGLKYAIGAAALFTLIRTGALDPKRIVTAIKESPGPFLVAMILYLGVNIFASVRWYLLLRAAQVQESGFRVFRLHMVGVFFSALLPGGTAGDLAKGFFLFRRDDAAASSRAIASLVMDRITGMLGLLSLALITGWSQTRLWWHQPALRAFEVTILVILLIVLAILGLALRPETPGLRSIYSGLRRLPGGAFISDAAQALAVYRGQWGILFSAFLLSMAAHASLAAVYWACAHALQVDLAWSDHLFAGPLCTLLNGLPIAPAGLGVGEAFGKWLYALLGVDSGGEILALLHICVFLTAAFCSLAYWFERRN